MNDLVKKRLKVWAPIALLFCVLVGLFVWWWLDRRVTQEQRDDYSVKLSEAQRSFEAHEYVSAINKYYDATKVVPTDIAAYEGIIKILLLKNRSADALGIVEKSANALSATDKSRLYVMVGNYYYENKEFEKAKDIYQKGIGLGVENMNADLMLGKSLLNVSRVEEAKRQFELDGYSGDDLIEATLLRSYIYSLSDYGKAENTLKEVAASDKFKLYYEEFSKVLQSLDTDTKFNSTKLARVFLNNGYPSLAVSILEPRVEELSEYVEGLYYLGRGYVESGQYDKGLEVLEKSLNLGYMQTDIAWVMARAYVRKNDLDSAIKYYSTSVSYAGKNIIKDLADEYILFLLRNKQYLKAAESVTNMLTSSQSAFLYLLGIRSNYELNEFNKIDYYLEQLKKIALTDEEKKEYLYWKGKILLKNENLTEANSVLNELGGLDKYNSKYYLLLGRYSVESGDSQAAKTAFEKAVEYDLDNSVTEEALKLLSNIN